VGAKTGYLLERIEEAPTAQPLKDYVRARARDTTVLEPSAQGEGASRNRDWKLIVNVEVEAET
jgi:predicted transcriptional regulator of viral defense system